MARRLTRSVMAGQFDDDPAKAKSRDYLRQKLLETFPDPAQREKLTAVFFTGPSLIEAEQIYLAAGLKPQNITGVERDPEAFAAVKAQNDERPEGERIRLFNGNDTELFAQGGRYNVISLDYVQNYGPELLASLDSIFAEGARGLDSTTLLAINLQARREQPKYQTRLFLLTNFSIGLWLSHRQHAFRIQRMMGKAKEYEEAEKATNLAFDQFMDAAARILRVAGMVRDHGSSMKFGRFDGALDAMRLGVANEVYVRTEFPLIRECSTDDLRAAFESNQAYRGRSFDAYRGFIEQFEEFSVSPGSQSLSDPLTLSLYGYCMPCALFASSNARMADDVPDYLRERYSGSCLGGLIQNELNSTPITEYDHYNYVSSSRAPMLMQVFTIQKLGMEAGTPPEDGDMEALVELMSTISRISYDNTPKYRILREAASRYYGQDVFPFRVLGDLDLWKKFRVGQDIRGKLLSGRGKMRSMMADTYVAFLDMMEVRVKTHKAISKLLIEQRDYFMQFKESYNRWLKRKITKLHKEGKLRFSLPDGKGTATYTGPLVWDDELSEGDGNGRKEGNGKGVLTNEDKETIRELALEGHSPQEIHDTFFAETDVTIGQVRATIAWNKIYARKAAESAADSGESDIEQPEQQRAAG